ncbi:DUF695 domain-containing protein [Nemorincola caseinilytica]|uniref:DUF695 domain-containing protein n=1 Tax=Nemorincola caseinilytica TaxID=2054315 RepID=A0ABP8N8H4_9BACT
MIHFRSWALIAILLSAANVQAQENWDVYMSLVNSKPGSIMVDMGLVDKAPDKLLPYLVVTGPRAATNCTDKRGLPSATDIDDMEKVLDLTGSILSSVTAKRLAGTLTCNCERLNYYYVRDTAGVRNALARMYTRHFGDRPYTVRIKPDPEWTAYRNFLYPDSAAREWMASDKIIASMIAAGDDLARPRDITHGLYFLSEEGRERFADSAIAHHFTISGKKVTSGVGKSLYEISVSHHGGVRMDSILATEAQLKLLAAPLGGTYRTWQAPYPKK